MTTLRSATTELADAFDRLTRQRWSCRAYLPDPVSHDLITTMLDRAQRTPSWCNTQPWNVTVTEVAATDRFHAGCSHTRKNKRTTSSRTSRCGRSTPACTWSVAGKADGSSTRPSASRAGNDVPDRADHAARRQPVVHGTPRNTATTRRRGRTRWTGPRTPSGRAPPTSTGSSLPYAPSTTRNGSPPTAAKAAMAMRSRWRLFQHGPAVTVQASGTRLAEVGCSG